MAFWEKRPGLAEALDVADETDVLLAPRRMSVAPKGLVPQREIPGLSEAAIAEYETVAGEIGLNNQDILVEKFRLFLAKHDLPTFKLSEVVTYMDKAAARDNPNGFGWHWCPVREKDGLVPMSFGLSSREERYGGGGGSGGTAQMELRKIIASDFYESHQWQLMRSQMRNGMISSGGNPMPTQAYTRTMPLHAMKKIALIERNFTDSIVFLVSDYATAPHAISGPDPFLMAVIPNSAVGHGKGRFVIDVWDEPGFGIEQMIK
jgi:hypothetical protein